MATARVTHMVAMRIRENSKVCPVANFDVDPFDVEILSNDMMVGVVDTLPSRGGARKVSPSFDTHLFGAIPSIGTSKLSTAASITKNWTLAPLFQSSGFTFSTSVSGFSFAVKLSNNPNADVVPCGISYWQGDHRSTFIDIIFDPEIQIKAGEYITVNWNGEGLFAKAPVFDTSYPTWTPTATPIAAINGTFALSFGGSISYMTTITDDVLEMTVRPNNTLVMNKDITSGWGYSDGVIVAPRKSEITLKLRAPYSIGKTGTDFWKIFQKDGNVQCDGVLAKVTYTVEGCGNWNHFVFTGYFKMNQIMKQEDVGGVLYYNIVGQLIPFTSLGAAPFQFVVKRA